MGNKKGHSGQESLHVHAKAQRPRDGVAQGISRPHPGMPGQSAQSQAACQELGF